MFRSRLLPRAGKSLGLGLRTTFNARRSLHAVPTLPHDYSKGVPHLMSAGGFAIAWSDYMSFVLEKLNALTVGSFCRKTLEDGHLCLNGHPFLLLNMRARGKKQGRG